MAPPEVLGREVPHLDRLAEEADVLAAEMSGLEVPCAAVLGNHDYHAGEETDIAAVMAEVGDTVVLEGDTVVLDVAFLLVALLQNRESRADAAARSSTRSPTPSPTSSPPSTSTPPPSAGTSRCSGLPSGSRTASAAERRGPLAPAGLSPAGT